MFVLAKYNIVSGQQILFEAIQLDNHGLGRGTAAAWGLDKTTTNTPFLSESRTQPQRHSRSYKSRSHKHVPDVFPAEMLSRRKVRPTAVKRTCIFIPEALVDPTVAISVSVADRTVVCDTRVGCC